MPPASNVMFIACGSFSPVTHMHLRMFEIARDHFAELGHNVLGGIISPVHDSYGKDSLVAATHRTAMLRLALQSSPWIRLSDWECMQQTQWTRTRHSLQYHQNYVNSLVNSGGNNGSNNSITEDGGPLPAWLPNGVRDCTEPVRLKLLCGADLLESFAVPGLWQASDIEAILVQHGLIVISRSGSNPERFIFESDTLTRLKQHITIVTNWVPNEVSSSISRRLLSRGASVKYLMDDAVIEYIKKYDLYGSNASTKYILSPNQNTYQQRFDAQRNALNDNATIVTRPVQSFVNYRYDDMDETDYPPLPAPPPTDSAGSSPDDNDARQPLLERARQGSRVFCCGETLGVKTLLSRPGGAVKVLPTATTHGHGAGDNNDDEDEVGGGEGDGGDAHKHNAHQAQSHTHNTTVVASAPSTTATSAPIPPNVMALSPTRLLSAHDYCSGISSGSGGSSLGVQFLSDHQLDKLNGFGHAVLPCTSDRTQDDLIQFVFTSHGIRVISNKECA